MRYAGVDILADPGDFCGRDDHAWRSYFRSTIAHNTAELGGRGQSSENRPFARARHAQAREIEVLGLLARGQSNKEIALRLVISRKTVGTHVEHIYAKTGASNRAQASLFAVKHGLLADV